MAAPRPRPAFTCPQGQGPDGSEDCPMTRGLGLLATKWTPPILYHLHQAQQPLRFSGLRRLIPAITQKELTKRLRELEANGIVSRQVFAEVPPRVEYALTEFGLTLEEPLGALARWAMTHGHRLLTMRAAAKRA